jgi:hypothetical protein
MFSTRSRMAFSLSVLISAGGLAAWCLADGCDIKCYEVSCWQVAAGGSPDAYNCRRSMSTPICDLQNRVWIWDVYEGHDRCEANPPQTTTIEECKDCTPVCDNTPGIAFTCTTDCRVYIQNYTDTKCVDESD